MTATTTGSGKIKRLLALLLAIFMCTGVASQVAYAACAYGESAYDVQTYSKNRFYQKSTVTVYNPNSSSICVTIYDSNYREICLNVRVKPRKSKTFSLGYGREGRFRISAMQSYWGPNATFNITSTKRVSWVQ